MRAAGSVAAVSVALLSACAPTPAPEAGAFASPTDAVADIVAALPPERERTIDVATVPARPDRRLVTVEATGYRDDSLAGERWRVLVERAGDGWRVVRTDRQNLCARGTVAQRWTTEPCP